MAKVKWTVMVDEDIPVKCAVCAAHDSVPEGKIVEDMIRGYHTVVKAEQEGKPVAIGVNMKTGDAGFVEMPGRPTYPEKSVAEEFGMLKHLTDDREESEDG